MTTQSIYSLVRDSYGKLAEQASLQNSRSEEDKIAQAFGYSVEDLQSLPIRANLGVSCGNPLATAKLRIGETVVDLGSGGGLDVVLAARKVGPEGRVYGIDMTERMIKLARANIAKAGVTNTEFLQAPITAIPLKDSVADCVISNCVINLVPSDEKGSVFREVFRILKPGGRVAISDILARQRLSKQVTENVSLYVGCIAGASQIGEYQDWLEGSGFQDILIVDTKSDLNVYKQLGNDSNEEQSPPQSCCSPQPSCCSSSTPRPGEISKDIRDLDFNIWAGSFQIYAVKPTLPM